MGSLWVTKAVPLTQIAYAAASITNAYTVAGTFTSPVVLLIVTSTLDQPVQISFDGIHDHLPVAAGNTVPVYLPLNFKDNRSVLPNPSISVKQIGAPTVGSLYISAFSSGTP